MSDDEALVVIPHGGEVHYNDDRDVFVADRLKVLPGGFIWAVNKNAYELRVIPSGEIAEVATYTKHLENEEWF